MKQLIIGVAAALVSLCSLTISAVADEPGKAPEDHTAVEQELLTFKQSLMSAFNAGDIDAVVAHAHPEVTVTWQNGEVTRGRDEAQKYFNDKMKRPDSPLVSVTENPQVDFRMYVGQEIVSFGNMNDVYTLRDIKEPVPMNSRFTAVITRDAGGKLELRALHMSINAFDNPIVRVQRNTLIKYASIAATVCLVLGFFIGRFTRWKSS